MILPDHIRTRTTVERKRRHSIILEPGQTPSSVIPEIETMTGHSVLWTKIRADFTTMSIVTVSAPDFFPYDSCEQVLSKILVCIF